MCGDPTLDSKLIIQKEQIDIMFENNIELKEITPQPFRICHECYRKFKAVLEEKQGPNN